VVLDPSVETRLAATGLILAPERGSIRVPHQEAIISPEGMLLRPPRSEIDPA